MSNAPTEETVLDVEHYTDRLFRFNISRPTSFRFRRAEQTYYARLFCG